jgi:hypothetical protein
MQLSSTLRPFLFKTHEPTLGNVLVLTYSFLIQLQIVIISNLLYIQLKLLTFLCNIGVIIQAEFSEKAK